MGLTKTKNCILYEKLPFEQFGSFQLEMLGAPGGQEIQVHTSGLQHSESSLEPQHPPPWGRALSPQHWQSSSLLPSLVLSLSLSPTLIFVTFLCDLNTHRKVATEYFSRKAEHLKENLNSKIKMFC